MLCVIGNSEDLKGQQIAKWYTEQVNKPLYGPYASIGFVDKMGFIRGAVVLMNWNGSNIEAHIYAPRCFCRGNINYVLSFVFKTLKARRLTAIVEKSNKKVLRLLPKLDFIYETVLKEYFGASPKGDGVVYKMTPIQAEKWMK